MKYKVQLVTYKTVPVTYECTVEADSEEEAEDMAVEMADENPGEYYHGDSSMDEAWEVIEVKPAEDDTKDMLFKIKEDA